MQEDTPDTTPTQPHEQVLSNLTNLKSAFIVSPHESPARLTQIESRVSIVFPGFTTQSITFSLFLTNCLVWSVRTSARLRCSTLPRSSGIRTGIACRSCSRPNTNPSSRMRCSSGGCSCPVSASIVGKCSCLITLRSICWGIVLRGSR